MSARSGGRFLCDALPRRAARLERRVRARRRRARRAARAPTSSSRSRAARSCSSPPTGATLRDAADGRLVRGDRGLRRQGADDGRWPSAPASRRRATHLARTPEEFRAAAAELGYPEREVCMKPPQAKGSRGFRVLSATRRPPPRAARGAPGPAAALGRRGARGHRRRGLPAAARDGARDREGAHRRRHLPRRPARARPREDARGDARRARDVLRDRRAAGARGRRAAPRARSCGWTGS